MENIKSERLGISKTEKIIRWALWTCLEAFVIGSLIYNLFHFEITHILMCVGTVGLLFVPFLACKIFRFEMNTVFFCFCLCYAVGPMLGHIYDLYYLTSWWDDLLHFTGGVVFAIFGIYLAGFFNRKGETSFLMKATFALFFSIALAGLWEFVEYGCDQIFHTDMQNDRVVYEINSYLLGGELGETGTFKDISEVLINGRPLGVNGYLDIGLHDTMSDMLLESLGAVVFTVIYAIDKERHPLIVSRRERQAENVKEN